MYKQASKMKLRFNTEKGILTVEQLWDLSRAALGRVIVEVNKALKESSIDDELGFLKESSVITDPENTLRFNILKDIFLTKKEEAEKERNMAEVKRHNEKIDSLILRKEEASLEEKSIEELMALRKS